MAFNNGFPINYQQAGYPYYGFQPTQPAPQTNIPPIANNGNVAQRGNPQTNDTGILWVQGEAGAKSYPVAPGKSVMLMDSETDAFYIKSADASGMPLPLRVFDYKERTAQPQAQHQPLMQTDQFVTWEALEQRLAEIINDKKPTAKKEGK